jgi:hypothetical protein
MGLQRHAHVPRCQLFEQGKSEHAPLSRGHTKAPLVLSEMPLQGPSRQLSDKEFY